MDMLSADDLLDRPASPLERRLASPAVGLSVLYRYLSATTWVHRRVESVRVVDAGTIRRSQSIDLQITRDLPTTTEPAGSSARLVPLVAIRKEPLIGFSCSEETGRSTPVLTAQQHALLSTAGLWAWSSTHLDEAPDDDATRALFELVRGRARTDLHTIDSFPLPLLDDEQVGPVCRLLGQQFLLVAVLPAVVDERRVIKIDYLETIDIQGLEAGAGIEVTPFTFRLETASTSAAPSYHLELDVPADLTLRNPRLTVDADAKVEQQSAGRTVAFVVHGAQRAGALDAEVLPERGPWIRNATAAAWAVAFALAVTAVFDPVDSLDAGAPLTLLLAVVGAVSALLGRRDEHQIVTALLGTHRRLALTSSTLPFVAAGIITFTSGCLRTILVGTGAAIATGIAVLFTILYSRSASASPLAS